MIKINDEVFFSMGQDYIVRFDVIYKNENQISDIKLTEIKRKWPFIYQLGYCHEYVPYKNKIILFGGWCRKRILVYDILTSK